MSNKKTRSDAFETELSELQFLQLRDGLLDGTFPGYREAISWLAVECGVSTSPGALSRFWRDHCAPVRAERRQFAAARAEALGDAMRESPVDWDTAIVEKVKQEFFELLDSRKLDAKALEKILSGLVKERKQSLDEEKFDELKRKAAFADEVKKAAENREGGLTAEHMAEIERRLKLL